ncbi:MAG TPA: pseudouridine synthase [Chloroflexi bacterium]|nr:pseudouridine synthase [Chloroflexota bacterium]HPO57587.1 pseudouridine synthase [Anaerolineaceae bacterium]
MERLRYILFHKPYGVLSSFTDPEGRPTVKDYVDVPEVYAAGRLDFDSEGLMLLTNDGPLIHRLTQPRYHMPKTYLAQVEGEVTAEALRRLREGVVIKGYRTQPAEAEQVPDPGLPERSKPVTPHGPTSWIRLTLREGKKRQVRHMTAAVGLPTLRLVRVAIGPLTLDGLAPGEWRELTGLEKQVLLRSTGLRRG